ncbi:hypothetical protein Droror1_Dr00017347 [Drosera rotundifolia]
MTLSNNPKHVGRNNYHHKHRHHRHRHKHGLLLVLKWLLLFLLSLYLIFSFTSTTPLPISLSRFSAAAASRRNSALLESSLPTTTHHDNNNDSRIDVKVYIYDLPGRYNTDWLSNARCGTHLFASEVAIHRSLLSSPKFRTLDPYEADLFLVPVYVACNFSTTNGFPAIGHARGLIASAVELISSTLPFWNRSRGEDHVFVASHDFGACFHTMEDAAVADGVTEVMRRSIVLQTFGVEGRRHPCQDVEHVVIPPYVSPESVRRTLERWPLNGGGGRDIFAFFRGKMEVHPKNVSGRFYSKALRTKIWRKYANDRRFYLRRQRFPGYQSEIARSIFCLCPLGWAPWSPRLVESVALGCIPVIIADGIRLPFPEAIPWPDISLRVPEDHVDRLGSILERVARTNLTTIQENIRRPEVRRALMFNDEVEEGDATWQVLRELARRVGDRSRARRRLGNQ